MRSQLTSIVTTIAAVAATGAALAAVVPPGTAASASTGGPRPVWSATWTPAMQQPAPSTSLFGPNWSDQGSADQTVREKLRTSSAGDRIRLRLSDLDGTIPLHLSGARVAATTARAAIRPDTMRPVTFDGRRPVTLPDREPEDSPEPDTRSSP